MLIHSLVHHIVDDQSDQPQVMARDPDDNPWDDVFHAQHHPSVPTSPDAMHSEFVSEVPRLQSLHATAGYREGVSLAKPQFVQEGFDQGFSLGAELGTAAGCILGALQLLATSATNLSNIDCPAWNQSVLTALRHASSELSIEHIFAQTYFSSDGSWTYQLPQIVESDITFRLVALQHPLILKWAACLSHLVTQVDLDLNQVKYQMDMHPKPSQVAVDSNIQT